jgi:hypothetical protein
MMRTMRNDEDDLGLVEAVGLSIPLYLLSNGKRLRINSCDKRICLCAHTRDYLIMSLKRRECTMPQL